MALYDRLQAELVDARRRRDNVALDTLSLLKSELVKASKDTAAAGTLNDDLVVRIARKEVKRREEAIDVYRKAWTDAGHPGGRASISVAPVSSPKPMRRPRKPTGPR